ncbi:MAG: glucosamine-6-phosphate deaminase [Bacteroidota bacterium]
MKYNTASKVEALFEKRTIQNVIDKTQLKLPVLLTDNYVELGQLTALRFLEWVALNPGGVVALPTGKTPEFFIKWVEHYLKNWDYELNKGILGKIGFDPDIKPRMDTLHFFQLDEFFPISDDHERSFTYFVKNFYVEKFGFDPAKVNLINTYDLTPEQQKMLGNAKNLNDIFPDGIIDLGLRTRKPITEVDEKKYKTIKLFDSFCQQYEEKIRKKGGIGFFLGGIGPDGHIAFNVKGSSHFSHTRLTNINYETQATAATDLGGIELVRKKAVITIGLETITFNPDATAVIIAAGESKSGVVADAVEQEPALSYPATALQKLKNSRFYITLSAAKKICPNEAHLDALKMKKVLDPVYAEKLVIRGALSQNMSLMEATRVSKKALNDNPDWKLAAKLSDLPFAELAEKTYNNLVNKVIEGVKIPSNQRILHTAPHHDDIELAYFPLLHHLVRSPNNENHFVYCTSGFTAVTNVYVLEALSSLLELIKSGQLTRIFPVEELGRIDLAQDDITGYLQGIATQSSERQEIYKSTRLARLFLNHLNTKSTSKLQQFVEELIGMLQSIEAGRKEPDIIHLIKGWLREFEAELVWAHFGIDMDHVYHLRLHFYSDNIFPDYPDHDLDVVPILNLLEKTKPNIISLALDPEGSGPDTHYKTLIALAEAIDIYADNHPEMNIHIWGYRNIWSVYEPQEINKIIPVSLNSFAVLHNMFNSCFLSQRSASFPSYQHDGPFSELAQKIWVQQHQELVKLLGDEFFYSSPNPMLRRSYGAIYLKDMSYAEFKNEMKDVRRLLKAKEQLNINKDKK